MKIEKKSVYTIIAAGFALFLFARYWRYLEEAFHMLLGAITPVITGLIVAYILNILMCFYERHYFVKRSNSVFVKKSRRPACITMSIVTLVVIASLIVKLVVPELVRCIQVLLTQIPPFMENLLKNEYVSTVLPNTLVNTLAQIDWREYIANIMKILTSGISNAAETVIAAVSTIFSATATFVISIIFSIYFLSGKEKLQNQLKRLMNSYLPKKWIEKSFYVFSVFNDSFHRYIVGQCLEAVILGVLCILGMMIFRFPYAMMIGTLVGFTALIPIAGAYIGAGVGAIMLLSVSPVKAALFLVFIILLQQLEGNLIYPKVVGKSIGLPSVYVLIAITVGGGLFGIGGMLIGVPIISALYRLIRSDVIKREKS